MRDHGGVGPHVLIIWLRPDVLARQVSGFIASGDRYVLGLQAADSDENGREIVRLALTEATQDPSELAAAFTKVDTLILTTLSSLTDAPPDARFAGPQDLFVLVDLPPVEAVRHAAASGSVRWARFEIGGDRKLKGIVWVVDALPGVVHLHIASETAHVMLTRWLDAQPAEHAIADPDVLRSRLPRIDAVIQHVVACWYIIERQDRRDD
jgi:hypothetical protein